MTKRRPLMLFIAALLLPALLAGIIVATASQASTRNAAAPAAIVNNDVIATLPTGQQLPGGRQIIAALTEENEYSTGLTWSVVTDETAAAGLADGTFDAVVTLNKDFSQTLVDVINGDAKAGPGVAVQTSPAAKELTGDIATALARAAADKFGTSLTVNFLTESLAATEKMAAGLGEAASGARDLVNGQKQVHAGASQLSGGLVQAHDGSTRLAGGTIQLSDGVGQLASGLGQLSSGSSQLAAGTDELATGTKRLDGGARELSDGISQYVNGVKQLHNGIVSPQPGQAWSMIDGAAQLADGVKQYTNGVAQLHDAITKPQPGQSMSLQEGAHQLAAGGKKIAEIMDIIKPDQIQASITKLTDSQEQIRRFGQELQAQLQPLLQACVAGDQVACTQAQVVGQEFAGRTGAFVEGFRTDIAHIISVMEKLPTMVEDPSQLAQLSQLSDGTAQLANGIDQLADGIKTQMMGDNAAALVVGAQGLADGVKQLGDGSSQLAAAGDQLRSGASQLSSGVTELTSGASQLTSGANTLNTGVAQAHRGIQQVASGAAQLAPGATELANGLGQLANGSAELTSGLEQLANGGTQLADGLQSAADVIPVYTRDEAEAMATALGTPITVEENRATLNTATQWAPSAIGIAVWLASLVWVLTFGPTTKRRIAQPYSPTALTMRALKPAAVIAAMSTAVMVPLLMLTGVSIERPWALTLLAAIVSFAGVTLHLALVAAIGLRGGVLLSMILLVVQTMLLATLFPAQSHSGFFGFLRGVLPLPASEGAFGRLITGVGNGDVLGVATLCVLLGFTCLLVTIAAIARRRSVSVTELRAAEGLAVT